MARRKDLPCNRCGLLMWRGPGVLPAGSARCRPCRRIEPLRIKDPDARHSFTCGWCWVVFTSSGKGRMYCSIPCANKCKGVAQQIRPLDDHRVTRIQREHAAPGLNAKGRARLNHLWQQQGRACTYCTAKATTVDHVVPLVRGGTNYEGNLVPCCRPCNSSKSGHLVIEWRTGVRLPRMLAAQTV